MGGLNPVDPAESALLAALDEFAPTIKVTDRKGGMHLVAANPAANKALAQLTAARLRSLVMRYVEDLEKSGRVPDAKELKTLSEAAKTVENIAEIAYGAGKSKNHEFESFALRAVKMAASGANADGKYEARRRRMAALGKGVENAKKVEKSDVAPADAPVIDITPEPPAATTGLDLDAP